MKEMCALVHKRLYYFDVSIVCHFSEDGHVSGRNMYEVYYVYNIFSYT
jgi:hypothetical protein